MLTRGCAVFLIAMLCFFVYNGNTKIEVEPFEISSSKIPLSFNGFTIVQISDLHNAEFSNGNDRLLSLIKKENPDMIVITGDLVDSRRTKLGIALSLARQLQEIAPTFYVSGNHEARITEFKQLIEGLEQVGVTVLENKKVSITKHGETIRLIGVSDPSFYTDFLFDSGAAVIEETYCSLAEKNNEYSVLLSHRPELFDTYAQIGADLVFSGHAHGGQFRLPFVGGLFAPNQGFFPEYDSGLYKKDSTVMLVSRGLGSSIIPIRLFNPPHLVVAVLKSTK